MSLSDLPPEILNNIVHWLALEDEDLPIEILTSIESSNIFERPLCIYIDPVAICARTGGRQLAKKKRALFECHPSSFSPQTTCYPFLQRLVYTVPSKNGSRRHTSRGHVAFCRVALANTAAGELRNAILETASEGEGRCPTINYSSWESLSSN